LFIIGLLGENMSECEVCGDDAIGLFVCSSCANQNHDKLRKRSAIDFGYWLVNAPNKEIHKKGWIETKYKQYIKELEEKES